MLILRYAYFFSSIKESVIFLCVCSYMMISANQVGLKLVRGLTGSDLILVLSCIFFTESQSKFAVLFPNPHIQ